MLIIFSLWNECSHFPLTPLPRSVLRKTCHWVQPACCEEMWSHGPSLPKGEPWEKVTKTVISCQRRVRQGCLEVMQMRGTFPMACLIHSRPELPAREREKEEYSRGCPKSQRTFRTVACPSGTKTVGGVSLPCPSAHTANYYWAYYLFTAHPPPPLRFFKWFK